METTQNGIKIPTSQDIYNVDPYNDNAKILDEHLSNTDIHVNASKIAEIVELDELCQIDSTDTNSTMWGKIKKSISVLDNHINTVASETILGHVKIGTGLQTEKDGTTSVKVANDLETVDSTISLSAAMGKSLNETLKGKAQTNHASSGTEYGMGNASQYGHVKLSDSYTSSAGTAANGVGASSKAVADAYNTLNTKFSWQPITFTPSSTYISSNQSWAYKMGQVCICELVFSTKQQISPFSRVKIGTLSLASRMSTFCIGQIQSTSHTCVFSIGNANISSDEGYDIYLETLNNTIAEGEWLRGNLIYFTYL